MEANKKENKMSVKMPKLRIACLMLRVVIVSSGLG